MSRRPSKGSGSRSRSFTRWRGAARRDRTWGGSGSPPPAGGGGRRKAWGEKTPFVAPATLVKRQTIAMMQDTFQRLASQGLDLKKMNMDVDKMSERFAPNAERMGRVSLLIEAIAREGNIGTAFSEIDAG